MRPLSLVLLSGLAALVASAAGAAPVSPIELHVDYGGVYYNTYGPNDLGCAAGGGESFGCSGTNFNMGDMTLNSWNLSFDPDPVQTGIIAVTNNTLATQQFTLTFILPISAIPGGTLIGGSIQGGVTDNNGDGATLSTAPGSALYTALIDGVVHQTLFADPTVLTVVNPFDSADLSPPGAFGTPIPGLPGPGVATSIGIRYDFTLTGQDAASFTGVFDVEPIPEPGTAALFGLGLGGLALLGRAKRS